MIEPGVELLHIVVFCKPHVDVPEHLLPGVLALKLCLIESHVVSLRLAVQTRILDRRIGDTHSNGHLFILLGGEVDVKTSPHAIRLFCSLVYLRAIETAHTSRLLVHHSREVDGHLGTRLIFLHIFGKGDDIALDGSVVANLYMGILHGAALTRTVADVEENAALLRLGIGVALEGHTRSSGQLSLDAIVLQHDGVVAGGGRFLVVRELRTISLALRVDGSGNGLQLAAGRHEHNATHLELMGAGKALDGAVTVVVARGLPSVLVAQMSISAGTGLCHSERHGAGGEVEITTMGRTDTRLYKTWIPLADGLGCVTTCRGSYQAGKQQ